MSNKDYYSILDVNKDASIDDIKKSFRKLALKHHPDRGGNPETFKEINEAHDILSDPSKKQKYDFGGNDSINLTDLFGHRQSPFSPFMSSFFQQDMFNQNRTSIVKINKTVDVDLHEAYSGCEKVIEVVIDEICNSCNNICSKCNGKKMVEKLVTNKTGCAIITQKYFVRCEDCNGSGKTSVKNTGSLCKDCNNTKKKTIKNKFKVSLPNRTFHDFSTHIKHPTLINYIIDVNVVIHFPKYFTRQNNDLCYTKHISVIDCLIGTTFEIPHPSGENIVIDYTKKHDIIKPHTCVRIPCKGIYQNSSLLVKFDIAFPTRRMDIDASEKQQAFKHLKENYNKLFTKV